MLRKSHITHVSTEDVVVHHVERLAIIDEAKVELLVVLSALLNHHFQIKDLISGSSSWSEASLFFSDFGLQILLHSVCDDFQENFATVTNECDRSVVVALQGVTFFQDGDEYGVNPVLRPFLLHPYFGAQFVEVTNSVLAPALYHLSCYLIISGTFVVLQASNGFSDFFS